MYETVSNCFLMRFMVYNEIHNPLGAGYNPGKVKQGLRAQMHFNHSSSPGHSQIYLAAVEKNREKAWYQ